MPSIIDIQSLWRNWFQIMLNWFPSPNTHFCSTSFRTTPRTRVRAFSTRTYPLSVGRHIPSPAMSGDTLINDYPTVLKQGGVELPRFSGRFSVMKAITVLLVALAITPASAQIVRCQDGVFRGASDCPGARQAPPAIKTEAPRPAAPVSRADAEDLARVESLRANCDAAGAAVKKRYPASTPDWVAAVGRGSIAPLAIAYCSQYERAVKDRQRYEALRSEDPAAAAKELEVQRLAREERRRNRPVITNCTKWAADRVTCISQ